MMLFVIQYHGSYCMCVQIVRASSYEEAQAMAKKPLWRKNVSLIPSPWKN